MHMKSCNGFKKQPYEIAWKLCNKCEITKNFELCNIVQKHTLACMQRK